MTTRPRLRRPEMLVLTIACAVGAAMWWVDRRQVELVLGYECVDHHRAAFGGAVELFAAATSGALEWSAPSDGPPSARLVFEGDPPMWPMEDAEAMAWLGVGVSGGDAHSVVLAPNAAVDATWCAALARPIAETLRERIAAIGSSWHTVDGRNDGTVVVDVYDLAREAVEAAVPALLRPGRLRVAVGDASPFPVLALASEAAGAHTENGVDVWPGPFERRVFETLSLRRPGQPIRAWVDDAAVEIEAHSDGRWRLLGVSSLEERPLLAPLWRVE